MPTRPEPNDPNAVRPAWTRIPGIAVRPESSEPTEKWKLSARYCEQRAALSLEQRAAFDELIEWYRFSQVSRGNHPFVNYIILADLIRAGWRRQT